MTALVHRRCIHHVSREAVSRCRYFANLIHSAVGAAGLALAGIPLRKERQ